MPWLWRPEVNRRMRRKSTLRRLRHETGADAAGANAHALSRAADRDVHVLQVRPLLALGLDVRVTDVVGHSPLFATNCTLRRHGFSERAYH